MKMGPARQGFREAASFFSETVGRIPNNRWDGPGLGVWSVRELVGHTSRGLLAMERYAALPATPLEVSSASDYYRRALSPPDIHTRIAEGGHQAGTTLGDNPAELVATTAQRVVALVESLPDDHPMRTQVGTMRLADYLATRVMELTVHTLDICQAVALPMSASASALRLTLSLIADLAVETGNGAELILAATGRGPLPNGFSVVA